MSAAAPPEEPADTILAEDYLHKPGLPVMICVLTLPGATYAVGKSISRADRFEPKVARMLARRHALEQVPKLMAFRETRSWPGRPPGAAG